MKLLTFPAGLDTEQGIRRAPADNPRSERDDPKIGPGGFRPQIGKSKNEQAGHYPNRSFPRTNILPHTIPSSLDSLKLTAHNRSPFTDATIPDEEGESL